ncbi:AraC family transcriptional regulator [Pokkaliibacter sp. CJK22405]|uniref:AraC family transcriptional regulator n=1 Tax=Pokkaliibacter sp. CJK22405 TaxID=3384615 RepID=UPI0039846AC1
MNTMAMTGSERTISVPSGYVGYLLRMVDKQGYDVDSLLASVDISPAAIAAGEDLSAEKFGQLYQRIIWVMQDESFGMLSGGKVPNGTFRMMCYCILHCQTLEKALRRCSDFYEVCRGSVIKPVLTKRGRYAKLSFAPLDSQPAGTVESLISEEPPVSIRTSLSVWHHFLSWLVGRRLELKAVYFSFDTPEDEDHYRRLFHAEIRFNQHDNVIVFPARYLDLPLVQTEETLRGFLKTAPYQLMVMVDDAQTLKSQIVAILGKDFSREMPSADDVASKLNMSISTLRRRLLDEDTSYQKIKDECRRDAAVNYMNSPHLSINDIAALMGFDEPSAFFRSFKKWTGMTPGEYRQKSRWQDYA